jgi:hypothetical protein
MGKNTTWFPQDRATAHTAHRPRAILKEMLPGRVVSLHEAVPWKPRSPDLSPCDFFLWGYLKAEVFKYCPRSLDQLKEAIQAERLQMFIGRHGYHLDDIILKT